MARVRMVTRTVKVSICETMGLNITTGQGELRYIPLTGEYKGEDAKDRALKALKKAYADSTYCPCVVNAIAINEELRGMTEQKFIELSEVLPPRFGQTEDAEDETEE